MDSLMEYSNNFLKTSGGLWQCYRDEPPSINVPVIDVFSGNTSSFKYC